MKSFTEKILAYRWLIIILITVGTLFFGYQLKNMSINADIISSLPDNDPDAALLKQIAQKFGSNSMGIVILETDDIYQTEVIEHVKILSDSLAEVEGVSSITSLTNIINIMGTEEGFEVGKLVDEYNMPESPEDFDLLKSKVMGNDMYRGSIVSEDGTSTLVIFTLASDADVKEVAKKVIAKTEELQLPEEVYFIGAPMLLSYISDLMKKDLIQLLPIAFIVIGLILLFSFRSAKGVILPLLVAVISIVWSLGVMATLGVSMSMISNNIPIILLAVGSAYAIHVLNRVEQIRQSDPEKAIQKALAYVMVPVLLAATTTIIGFISFIFGSYLNMITDFGVYTALGTFFACLFSIFLVPSLLSVFETKKTKSIVQTEKKPKSYLTLHFLTPLKDLIIKHPKYIFSGWAVLIMISIAGVFSITRSVDIQDYFKEGNPTREAERIMIEKFGGTKPIFVLFKGDMQSPEVLKMMQATADYMKQSPDITSTQSVADLIVQLNTAVTGEEAIPEDQNMIEQLWFLIDGNETLERFVSEDLDEGIIISKFRSPDNVSKKEFAKYMREYIEIHSIEDCEIQITGMPFVDITMDRSLINSQISSILIAIIFAIIIVGFILRSFYSGLYAAIPIMVAIIILFGVMGLTGIPLNIATVLVASVALGIGIDYSIHIISHFNHSYKESLNAEKAIEEAILISGKAILINVLSVSTGFLVLVFSDMVPLQYFGILIALSMIGSSLGALTLLPVILILVHRKKLKRAN